MNNVNRWVKDLTTAQQSAYDRIRKKIEAASYVVQSDIDRPFHIFCDASIDGIGGMLGQYDDDSILWPVAFCSKVFNKTQRNWHVSEQEIYSVIYMCEK